MAMTMLRQRPLLLGVLAVYLMGPATAFSPLAAPILRKAAVSYSSRPGGLLSPAQSRIPAAARVAQIGSLALRADGTWGRMDRVEVSGDNLKYTINEEGLEVGVIQATKALTPEKPYFEVTVVDGGTQSWIGVGLADMNYPLDKQPGWDQASIGYHADDGMMYRSPIPDEMSKSGRPQPMSLTGQPHPAAKGDKMGVGVEFDKMGKDASMNPRRVFFTKNGVYLGSVLVERQYHGALYPTIGFNSPGATVSVNFDAQSASVELAHAAQFFGTNNYALDIAEEEIKKGANVNVQDTAGRTPLHMASAYGASPIATLLLEKGADPDLQVSQPSLRRCENHV
jgi:hypothetical protein